MRAKLPSATIYRPERKTTNPENEQNHIDDEDISCNYDEPALVWQVLGVRYEDHRPGEDSLHGY